MLEHQASAEWSDLSSAIEERDQAQNEVTTTSAKLLVAKNALTATFDHHKRRFSNVHAAEAAVQVRMKFNLRNFMQTVFDHVKQSTKAYLLNAGSDIPSLGASLHNQLVVCVPALPRVLTG